MKTIFSTAEVHPRDRFALWYEVACKTIVGHESRPDRRLAFEAAIQGEEVAGMSVLVFETAPMTIERTPINISQTPDDCLFVCQQLSGTLSLEQHGNQVVLAPGDITVVDARRSYHGHFYGASKLLALKVSRHILHARCGDLSQLLAHKTSPPRGLGRVLQAQLSMLKRGLGTLDVTAQVAVRDYTLDLIALSLAPEGTGNAGRSAVRSLALSSLCASIEMRLSDPELNSDSAARGAGISVRYANALLADRGTSLIRWIHERRLQKCHGALADPLQRHRTISDIAFGWGFSDLSHFGRLFRTRYGISPREFRQTRLAERETTSGGHRHDD